MLKLMFLNMSSLLHMAKTGRRIDAIFECKESHLVSSGPFDKRNGRTDNPDCRDANASGKKT